MNELRYKEGYNPERGLVTIFKFPGMEKYQIAGSCFSAGCTSYKKHPGPGTCHFVFYPHKTLERYSIGSLIWCPLTIEEINEHLEDINRVLWYPITRKIEDHGENYKINVWIDNRYNKRQVLYIITRIRYLYELPYCLFLSDALKLKKEEYPEKSIEEMFVKVVNTLPTITTDGGKFVGWTRICYYGRAVIFTEEKPEYQVNFPGDIELTMRLQKLSDYGSLNDLMSRSEGNTRLQFKRYFYNLSFWIENFEQRKMAYIGDRGSQNHWNISSETPDMVTFTQDRSKYTEISEWIKKERDKLNEELK